REGSVPIFRPRPRISTGNEVKLIDLVDTELKQPGGNQLLPDFVQGVGGVEGRDEIAPKHWRCALGMLIHQPDRRLRVRRSKQIDDQDWTIRLDTFRNRSPERHRIRNVM